jgi:hypothetical protein
MSISVEERTSALDNETTVVSYPNPRWSFLGAIAGRLFSWRSSIIAVSDPAAHAIGYPVSRRH